MHAQSGFGEYFFPDHRPGADGAFPTKPVAAVLAHFTAAALRNGHRSKPEHRPEQTDYRQANVKDRVFLQELWHNIVEGALRQQLFFQRADMHEDVSSSDGVNHIVTINQFTADGD